MTNKDIYGGLGEIFQTVFARDDITLYLEMTANDLDGWDSFKHVEIILAVEERFKIRLHSKEIKQLSTVGDFVKIIAQKVQSV